MGMNYDIGTIISAFVTFGIIMMIVRFYLKFVASKRPTIQRPEWMRDERGE